MQIVKTDWFNIDLVLSHKTCSQNYFIECWDRKQFGENCWFNIVI